MIVKFLPELNLFLMLKKIIKKGPVDILVSKINKSTSPFKLG